MLHSILSREFISTHSGALTFWECSKVLYREFIFKKKKIGSLTFNSQNYSLSSIYILQYTSWNTGSLRMCLFFIITVHIVKRWLLENVRVCARTLTHTHSRTHTLTHSFSHTLTAGTDDACTVGHPFSKVSALLLSLSLLKYLSKLCQCQCPRGHCQCPRILSCFFLSESPAEHS